MTGHPEPLGCSLTEGEMILKRRYNRLLGQCLQSRVFGNFGHSKLLHYAHSPKSVGVVSHQQKSTQEPCIHHKLSTQFVLKKAQFPRVTTQNS
jgi:hypothetical protein